MANRQYARINYHGLDWVEMESYLNERREGLVQRMLRSDTDAREVENIRGQLMFLSSLLAMKTTAAQDLSRNS